jgi:tetratricopeptide (TPR) repeat protein
VTTDLKTLEKRALELMKLADFGEEAVRVNAWILEQSPANESAWTRLGRCHLEQRDFDEAVAAFRAALSLNPRNSVATNLLNEVRRRRAMTPTARERATTGFSVREFAMLETLSPDEAISALRSRIDALFDAINTTSAAATIVEARRRQGENGTKLFHANSFHAHATGHIFAFHHGGRREPQFSIGWFSSPPLPKNCVRIGIGFNTSPAGRSPDSGEGPEQAAAFFDRFQRIVGKSWTRQLADWMAGNSGFIQYGDKPPATDLLPPRAVEWLVNCQNAAALEWIFVGRWLFLDRPDDAKILGDRASLARVVEETFRALLPIWLSTYNATNLD